MRDRRGFLSALKKTVFCTFIIGLSVCITITAHSQKKRRIELTAQELLARVDRILNYPGGKIKGKIVHKRPDGKIYQVDVVGIVSKSDYTFRVISKTRGEEEKILYNNTGEVIWVYDVINKKKFNKTFSGRYDKIIGTNYTYDDLSNSNLQGNFNARITGDAVDNKGVDAYRLKLMPVYKRAGCYHSLVLFVRKTDYAPVRIDYFDSNQALAKRMYITKLVTRGNRLFPVKYTMMDMRTGVLSELSFFGFFTDYTIDRKAFNSKYMAD